MKRHGFGAPILALGVAAIVWISSAGALDLGRKSIHRLMESRAFGYTYAYAPSIIKSGATLHMFFCSTGQSGYWDDIRYSSSINAINWSEPLVILVPSDHHHERAACDPSIVLYKAPADDREYYYLFYSGSDEDAQTTIFVARSPDLVGPYAKWTRRKTWEINAGDPQSIMPPVHPKVDKTGFYGAGQQSVILSDIGLEMWFTYDTECVNPCAHVLHTSSSDAVNWGTPAETNLSDVWSVDVKFDSKLHRYRMTYIRSPHLVKSELVESVSENGIEWAPVRVLCGFGCSPPFSHNVGVAGSSTGGWLSDARFVAFGAPTSSDCGNCWGRWDLFGGILEDDKVQ